MEETNTQPAESGPTVEASPELVPLHEATDAELDAEFSRLANEAKDEPVEAEQPAGVEEANKQDAKPEEPTPAEEPKESKEPQADADLRLAVADLRKQLAGLELLNKRRTSELSETKKQLQDLREHLAAGVTDEAFAENPKVAAEKLLELKETEKQIAAVDQREQAARFIEQNQQIVSMHVKPEEFDVDGMALSLERDGLPQEVIQSFRANPYAFGRAETLIQLQRRARSENALVRVIDAYKKLEAENKSLKEKPNQVLQNVDRALRQQPRVSAGSGTAQRAEKVISESQIHNLSDEELEGLLRR